MKKAEANQALVKKATSRALEAEIQQTIVKYAGKKRKADAPADSAMRKLGPRRKHVSWERVYTSCSSANLI